MEIIIDGVIGSWEVDAKEIVSQIEQASGDMTIKLNSVGGNVIDGISIYNAIKKYDKGIVTVEIGAVAASIASYIALAGDKVTANTNSTYMIHLAWLYTVGNYIDLRKAADISEGLSSIIANVYVAKTKMEKSEAILLMEKETFYYGAEILEASFVDEIIDVDSTVTKTEAQSLMFENLKACNNAIIEHSQDTDLEAAAKLIPKIEIDEKVVIEDETKVVNLFAQQKRDRNIQILKRKGL